MNYHVGIITGVMFALDAHKAELVNLLFPGCSEGYAQEWYERDPFAFWCHLDLRNRARVVRFAIDTRLVE